MAFPADELTITVKAYIGADPADDPGDWPSPVDWSSRVLDRDVSGTRGRRTGTPSAASGQYTLWLNDSDLAISTEDLTGTPVSIDVSNVAPNTATVYPRFRGYVANVETEVIRGSGGHEIVTARVTLGGVLRQRTQGATPMSALYRAHRPGGVLADGLFMYWSLENSTEGELSPNRTRHRPRPEPLGTGADNPSKRFALAAAPVFAHLTFGSAGWSSEAPEGAAASVALNSAGFSFLSWSGPGSEIPAIALPNPDEPIRIGFAFRFADEQPDSPLTAGEKECTILRVSREDGGDGGWAVRMITSSSGSVYNLDTFTIALNGTVTHHEVTPVSLSLSVWHYVTFEISSSGGGSDTDFRLVLDGEEIHSGTASGVAWDDSRNINVVNVSRDVPGMANVTHFAVWNGSSMPDDDAGFLAMNGHREEQAHDRIARICTEEGIPYSSTATESQTCGPQPTADPVAIARDAELVDHGIVGEDIITWGLTYRGGRQRYNQDAAFTIDLTTYNVTEGEGRNTLRPVRNDSKLRNEWTVSRPNGSAVTARDAASIALKGRYNDSATVNVADDDQLVDEASWRVHEGTYTGRRWGQIPLDLGATPTLLPDWIGTELGDRADRTGHALSYQQHLDVQGYSERITRKSWTVDLYTEPYDPWFVFEVGHEVFGRADTSGSSLTLSISDSATSILVSTDSGKKLWTVDDSQFPFAVYFGSEVAKVTDISGSSSPQAFTVERGVNGITRAWPAGTKVQLAPVDVS